MTSRPHAGLRLFRSAREDRLTDVVIDPGSPQVVGDLRTYADRVLERPAVLAAERARGNLLGSIKRHAVRRAAGNFLYLATYARALIDAAQEQDDEMVDRLLVFNGVPGRLPGLYGFFVELVREELRPWPRALGTSEPDGWEGVGLPIIGVLTVAREALTEDQLTALSGTPVREEPAQKVLSSLRWLLDRRSDRIAFFHTSVNEFLAGQEAREKHPECWVDETRWHEQIAHRYRGTVPNWADLDWLQVDHYGLAHLVAHVLKAGPRFSAEAVDMVCPGLRSAVRREFGAERRFLELVDSVAHHVADGATVATGLPAMTYLGVVRHQAAQSSNALPPRVIGLLARMGRVKEALEHAVGITPSLWQVTAFAEILQTRILGPTRPRPTNCWTCWSSRARGSDRQLPSQPQLRGGQSDRSDRTTAGISRSRSCAAVVAVGTGEVAAIGPLCGGAGRPVSRRRSRRAGRGQNRHPHRQDQRGALGGLPGRGGTRRPCKGRPIAAGGREVPGVRRTGGPCPGAGTTGRHVGGARSGHQPVAPRRGARAGPRSRRRGGPRCPTGQGRRCVGGRGPDHGSLSAGPPGQRLP